ANGAAAMVRSKSRRNIWGHSIPPARRPNPARFGTKLYSEASIMNRRKFLGAAVTLAGGATLAARARAAAVPKMKIRRIRYYQPQRVNPTFNQRNRIVTVETDAGIT